MSNQLVRLLLHLGRASSQKDNEMNIEPDRIDQAAVKEAVVQLMSAFNLKNGEAILLESKDGRVSVTPVPSEPTN